MKVLQFVSRDELYELYELYERAEAWSGGRSSRDTRVDNRPPRAIGYLTAFSALTTPNP